MTKYHGWMKINVKTFTEIGKNDVASRKFPYCSRIPEVMLTVHMSFICAVLGDLAAMMA